MNNVSIQSTNDKDLMKRLRGVDLLPTGKRSSSLPAINPYMLTRTALTVLLAAASSVDGAPTSRDHVNPVNGPGYQVPDVAMVPGSTRAFNLAGARSQLS